jgi:hypothetical protein
LHAHGTNPVGVLQIWPRISEEERLQPMIRLMEWTPESTWPYMEAW